VSNPADLDWSRLPAEGTLAVTAAASTPEASVQAILRSLNERFRVALVEEDADPESMNFKPVAIG
jgi:4-hydroxy-3-methylbut-2-enyl diphosphate reductase IspH